MKTCPEPVQYSKGHNFGAYHYRVRHMDKPVLKIGCVSAIFSPARITTCRDGKFMVILGGRAGGYPAKFKNEGTAMPRQLIPLIQYVKELQEQGEDLHSLYIDESDVVQIDREDNAEEE